MPCLRHTSAVDSPASCSRRIPMICSSLNRLPLIVRPSIPGRTPGFLPGAAPASPGHPQIHVDQSRYARDRLARPACFPSMEDYRERMRQWRMRATELRRAAEATKDVDARAGLLRAASSYQEMADDLDRRLTPPDRE